MENKSSHIELLKRGQRVAITATTAIFLLAVSKFIVGYLFDSRILIADAFHSGVDVLAIFASWFGLWLASRARSATFPYGLYKAETFITLLIGVLITLAGIENVIEGYRKFFVLSTSQAFPTLPVIISIISVFVSFFVARMENKVGKQINSGALMANASEAFLDIGVSMVVFAGIILSHLKIPYVEGSIIIFIALLILRLGLKNIWTPILILMDANLDLNLQSELNKKITSVEGVKHVKNIKIRQSGPFKMVECSITTLPNISVFKAHEITEKIENLITTAYKEIESVFVHVEPDQLETLSVIIPVKEINGFSSRVHEHFGRAPYFIILKLNNTEKPEIEDFYYNEFLSNKDRIHIAVKVIKAVIKHNLDIVFTPKIGEIAFHMLKDNYIDIFRVNAGMTVEEVIKRYNSGDIEPIISPHPAEESLVKQQYTEKLEANW
ncbi:MAG TPA: cation diffusion facilitator family transporter [Syntrophorhabdaceae bacterium]|nr:cation diffusion facilitator family transporter [Syntrophorhabdaceae bacterium]HOF58493.1 cation diffusion facilitator family transporter [Syntrophorhabdaceae bacterium]HOG40439.1 cation diffusion facilitator family transporter [Syntrophorhabdaceae bacterium]HOS05977.1 cation diffusion facilitator family transporter [Syntrophorhabdaceae bacterium]HQP52048.1 cation diffusion facilitator family transporter [Syntrophorhabdaceae bacterium]